MQSDQLVVVDQLLCAMGPVVMVIHDLSIVKQPWWRLGILSSLRNLHIDWIPMSSGFYCPFFSCHPSSILITSVFCLFKHTSLANPQLQALGCQSPAHWSLVVGSHFSPKNSALVQMFWWFVPQIQDITSFWAVVPIFPLLVFKKPPSSLIKPSLFINSQKKKHQKNETPSSLTSIKPIKPPIVHHVHLI